MSPAPDPEGRKNGGRPAASGPGRPVPFTVPDDARELDGERDAWLREQRRAGLARGWARAWRRILLSRRWEPHGLSGPLVGAVLLVVAAVGSLAVVFGPSPTARPASAPLATQDSGETQDSGDASADEPPTGQAAPRPGRLLPSVALRTSSGAVDVRTARPGVLALVPPDCACTAALEEVFRQSAEFRLRLWLVGGFESLADVRRLAAEVGNGTAVVAEDPLGRLRATYAARGLTLLLVHSDGVVDASIREATADLRLEGRLASLASPGATSAPPGSALPGSARVGT